MKITETKADMQGEFLALLRSMAKPSITLPKPSTVFIKPTINRNLCKIFILISLKNVYKPNISLQ